MSQLISTPLPTQTHSGITITTRLLAIYSPIAKLLGAPHSMPTRSPVRYQPLSRSGLRFLIFKQHPPPSDPRCFFRDRTKGPSFPISDGRLSEGASQPIERGTRNHCQGPNRVYLELFRPNPNQSRLYFSRPWTTMLGPNEPSFR